MRGNREVETTFALQPAAPTVPFFTMRQVVDATTFSRPSIYRLQRPCGPLPEFYSIREAMAVLALSRSELYRLVKAGELTIVKWGRRSFLSAADLSAYAEKLRRMSRQGAARK